MEHHGGGDSKAPEHKRVARLVGKEDQQLDNHRAEKNHGIFGETPEQEKSGEKKSGGEMKRRPWTRKIILNAH
jgi:hypothetical protein